MDTNYILINSLNLATAAAITSEKITNYGQRIEVQVDWTNITGSSLNATVTIEQQMASGMKFTCVDTDNLVKTLNTTTGTYTFLLWQWTAETLNIKITKNAITSGTISVAIGYRS